MYVHTGRFVLCYRVHYVIKGLIYGPDKGAYYAYAYTVYVLQSTIRIYKSMYV